MHQTDQQRLQDLEKQNRILQKKLQRSETNRIELEKVNDLKESLLRQAIEGLQTSEAKTRDSHHTLETTLSELRRTQAQLIQSEKMSSLGQLVAGIAHEINNPTGFIYGNLEFALNYADDLMVLLHAYRRAYPEPTSEITELLEQCDLDFVVEDFPKVLRSIKTGAERIDAIVRSLRSFSRLDESAFKAVDLHEGIDSTLMILDNRIKTNDIKLVKAYGELPQVECYAGELNQVFLSLLGNAIDALESKPETEDWQPTLTIQTQALEGWLRISMIDNGTGIPADIQARLFDPFFTTKPVGQGTGLGLSISYQIVTERHHGRLYCRSQLGEGAEFHLEIPVSAK